MQPQVPSPPQELQRPALYLVPTPIGNLQDMSARALSVLQRVDLIAAEDTRHSAGLFSLLGIPAKGRLVSYHEHNAQTRSKELAHRIAQENLALALVTDAGTPACSDPGYRLVRAVAEAGITVIPLPGPAAFLCALVASGLPTDRFLFVGFLSPKTKARRQALEALQSQRATLCLYVSPRRIIEVLRDSLEVLGDRKISVSRELTKRYEETLRGSTTEVLADLEARDQIRGEVALIIQGAPETSTDLLDPEVERLVKTLQNADLDPRTIKTIVAQHFGLSKKEVYGLLKQ